MFSLGWAITLNKKNMGIKPGPKRIAKSTGKPDRRQRDNKKTPGNTSSLKPHIHKKGDWLNSRVSMIPSYLKIIIDMINYGYYKLT